MFIGTCAKFVYLATASRDDNAPNVIEMLDSKFFTIYLLRLTNPDLIGIKRPHVHLTLGVCIVPSPPITHLDTQRSIPAPNNGTDIAG
jgi:hypothetical protein